MQSVEIKIKEIIREAESENCYRMIFEDLTGEYQLPVVISSYDARPLLAAMEGDTTRRPQTHDAFYNFVTAVGYVVRRVDIVGFERGIFRTMVQFDNFDRVLELDCRPTDAVALALRSGATIHVTREILEKVGTLLGGDTSSQKLPQRLKVMKEKLERLIADERYEEAAVLRDRIRGLKSTDS